MNITKPEIEIELRKMLETKTDLGLREMLRIFCEGVLSQIEEEEYLEKRDREREEREDDEAIREREEREDDEAIRERQEREDDEAMKGTP